MSWSELASPALLPLWGLLYKGRDLLRRPDDRALRWICAAFLALTVALTLLIPSCYRAVDSALGVPHIARLMAHSFGILNGCSLQALMLTLSLQADRAARRIRLRLGAAAVCIGCMTTLFLLAPIDRETADFATVYARDPLVAAYLITFVAYLSFSLADVGVLAHRHAPLAFSPFLRWGLKMISIGCGIGLLYSVDKLAYLLAGQLGTDLSTVEAAVSALTVPTSVLLVTAGFTLPSWGPRLARQHAAARSRWLYRRLGPLRDALVAAAPPVGAAEALPRGPEERLHHRVVEVHDALLAIRPFMDSIDATAAGSPSGSGTGDGARRDAARIAGALARRRGGRPTGNIQPPLADHSEDLLEEAARLARVSIEFSRIRPRDDDRAVEEVD